jgi:YidC/Oxa1 family membrane protein insertase
MHHRFFAFIALSVLVLPLGPALAEVNDQVRKKCIEFGFKDKTPPHDTCMRQFLQATGAAGEPANSAAVAPTVSLANGAVQSRRIEVSTDIFKITFDIEGGTVIRTEFLKSPISMELPKNLVLLDNSRSRIYMAQTGLVGSVNGSFPTHKTPMVFSGDQVMRDGVNELLVQFQAPVIGGIKLLKTYTFHRGSYVVVVAHKVLNVSTTPVAPILYLQLVRDGNREDLDQLSNYATFTGPAIYTAAKKFQRIEFKEIEEGSAVIEKQSSSGYVAMVQHYFASAWLLGDGVARDNFLRKVDTNLYSVGMITRLMDVAPGTTASVEARLFIGPRVDSVTTPLKLEAMQDDGLLLNFLKRQKR